MSLVSYKPLDHSLKQDNLSLDSDYIKTITERFTGRVPYKKCIFNKVSLDSNEDSLVKQNPIGETVMLQSFDYDFQNDVINFESSVNENINQSNIMQSTKNKLKKTFEFQNKSNQQKSQSPIHSTLNSLNSSMNQHVKMFKNTSKTKNNTDLGNLQQETLNMTQPNKFQQFKSQSNNKQNFCIKNLNDKYIQLSQDLNCFKQSQMKQQQELNDQIQILWKLLNGFLATSNDTQNQKHIQNVKQQIEGNSPPQQKQVNFKIGEKKQLSFLPQKQNYNTHNSRNKSPMILQTKDSQDESKIFFQTSVSNEKLTLKSQKLGKGKNDENKSTLNIQSPIMPHSTKNQSSIQNQVKVIKNSSNKMIKPRGLIINTSDYEERPALKQLRTPQINTSSQNQKSSFSKDINLLSENVEDDQDPLLPRNNQGNKRVLLSNSNYQSTGNNIQKSSLNQLTSPSRRNFEQTSLMNYEMKDMQDVNIGIEGYCKEKYQTAPLRMMRSSKDCQCIAFDQKCSNIYCKYSVTAEQQKHLIIIELEKCFEKFKQSGLYKFSQIEAQTPLDMLKAHIGTRNERKYLISTKWWQQWCDYVNFRFNGDQENSEFNESSKDIHVLQSYRNEYTKRDTQQQYKRPGIILNNGLLMNNQSLALRDNLIEKFDYIAVPSQVWKYLYSWFSTDWCISRRLIKDSIAGSFIEKGLDDINYDIVSEQNEAESQHKLTLELYPYIGRI
eukprot:403370057